MKKTAILLVALFIGGTAMAQDIYKSVTVKCETPSMMAGGESVFLRGQLDIVVSATTGMTKVKAGSKLQLTVSDQSGDITVQGIYFESSNREHIEGSVDEDMSPFTTLDISFADSAKQQRSFIRRANGKMLPLVCSH